MPTLIASFGYKHRGALWPLDTTVRVIDLRPLGFANPHRVPAFRSLPGTAPQVRAYIVERTKNYPAKYQALLQQAQSWAGPVYLGCVGGQHRSVFLASRLAADLKVDQLLHFDLVIGGE